MRSRDFSWTMPEHRESYRAGERQEEAREKRLSWDEWEEPRVAARQPSRNMHEALMKYRKLCEATLQGWFPGIKINFRKRKK